MRTRAIIIAVIAAWLAAGVFEVLAAAGAVPVWPDRIDRWIVGAMVAATAAVIAVVALRSSLPYQAMQLGREVEQEAQRRGGRARRVPKGGETTGEIAAGFRR